MARVAEVQRKTTETSISARLDVDGRGQAEISSGIGFFDHLLTQLARHGFFDLAVAARGDLEVDGHHTVEDAGIVLGQAFHQALGDRAGITRFGQAWIPLDEALAKVVVDVSGRPYLAFNAVFPQATVGAFELALVAEWLRAFSTHAGLTLHAEVTGANSHHMAEALFKALGRALDQATSRDSRVSGIPSTKGVL